MTDHDFEAEIETEHGTFTFSGDEAMVVAAQAARMPVLMHDNQLKHQIDLDLPIFRYLEHLAEQEQKMRENARPDIRKMGGGDL